MTSPSSNAGESSGVRPGELMLALENCRLLAARHRKEEWAGHILRFCASVGVTGSPLRCALPSPSLPAPTDEALHLLCELIAEEDAVDSAERIADSLGCEVNYAPLNELKGRVRAFIAVAPSLPVVHGEGGGNHSFHMGSSAGNAESLSSADGGQRWSAAMEMLESWLVGRSGPIVGIAFSQEEAAKLTSAASVIARKTEKPEPFVVRLFEESSPLSASTRYGEKQ